MFKWTELWFFQKCKTTHLLHIQYLEIERVYYINIFSKNVEILQEVDAKKNQIYWNKRHKKIVDFRKQTFAYQISKSNKYITYKNTHIKIYV